MLPVTFNKILNILLLNIIIDNINNLRSGTNCRVWWTQKQIIVIPSAVNISTNRAMLKILTTNNNRRATYDV